MRTGIAALLLIAGPACAQTAAADAAPSAAITQTQKLATARQIIDSAYPVDEREKMFTRVMDQIIRQMNVANKELPVDPGLQRIVAEHQLAMRTKIQGILKAHLPDMMEGWAQAYANIFSQKELDDILSFASTPSGRQYFKLAPNVLTDPSYTRASQAYMNEIMAILPEERAKVVADVLDYMRKKEASAKRPSS